MKTFREFNKIHLESIHWITKETVLSLLLWQLPQDGIRE